MKLSVIITSILITQVSASFFDVFHGAVLSVQNSFGKLLSDVVTDVKDTVDCTILAVEHVLSLSEDATIRYYDKCGKGTNKTDLQNDARQNESFPKVEVSIKFDSEEYLQKIIPAEIDTRINQTLLKVLGDYRPHENLLNIENVLARESEQLADVSDLVKNEIKKMTNEVNTDFERFRKRDSEPSVDTILQEIKVLEKREQNARNISETIEIHQVIDEVLDKLDAIEATEANENNKLEEILRDLENNSNNSFIGLRQQLEEWKEEESRHLSEIKGKIKEHEEIFNHSLLNNRYDYNLTHPIALNTDKLRDTTDPFIVSQGILTKKETQVVESLDMMRSRTNSDINSKLSTAVNEPLPSHNGEFNDVLVANTGFFITKTPYRSETIHGFETTTSVVTDASVMSSKSQFTTIRNMINNLNEGVTNVNETIEPEHTTKYSDKQDSTSLATNDLASNLEFIKENISNKIPVSTTNEPLEIFTASDNGENVMTNIISHDSNKTIIKSTSLPISSINEDNENETTQIFETTTLSRNEDFVTVTEIVTTLDTANVNDSNILNTMTISTKTPISTSSETIQAADTTTTSVIKESTLMLNKPISSNISGKSSSIGRTTISEIIILASNTAAKNEEPSVLTTYSLLASRGTLIDTDSNVNLVTSTPLPNTGGTLMMIQTVQSTTDTVNEEPSILTTHSTLASTAKLKDTGSDVSEMIQTVKSTTDTENEDPSILTMHSPLASAANLKDTGSDVSEKIQTVESTTDTENEEPSILTTYSPLASLATLIDTDSNVNLVASTPSPITESTLDSEILQSVTRTTPTINEESSTLTLMDPDYNTYLVTSTTLPEAENSFSNDMIQPHRSIAYAKNDDISILPENNNNLNYTTIGTTIEDNIPTIESKETTSRVTKNEILATSTTFPLVEENFSVGEIIIPVESTTASRFEDKSRDLTILVPDETLSSTPKILQYSKNLNYIISSAPLMVTDGPPVTNTPIIEKSTIPLKKGWLTPRSIGKGTLNKLNQQNHDTHGAPRRNNDFIGPQLTSEGLLNSRQFPLNHEETYSTPRYFEKTTMPKRAFNQQYRNPVIPNYHGVGKSDTISNRFSNVGAPQISMDPNIVTPSLIPNVRNQQPHIDAHDQAVFDRLDSMTAHLLNSGSPFSTMDEILDLSDVPIKADNRKRPIARISTDPRRMTPQGPLRSPYSFDRLSANTYAPPRGLTTYRPPNKARANDYQNLALDYDSFFHMPQKNSEAHQRALKEARQLIENSKLSDRIINSILQNKNNFGAKSIFNNPRILNSGK